MDFLKKIEPHLLSDDLLIQDFVLYIMEDYPFVPEEWTELLLREALSSKEKESSILVHASKLPLGVGALNLLIDGLKKADRSRLHLYLRFLDNLEPEMVVKYQQELKDYITKDSWDFYHLLLEGSEEEIWDAYGSLLGQLENEQSYNHSLYVKAKQLAKVIVKKGWIDEEEIDLYLKEQHDTQYFSFHDILHVYMIGLMKLTKYIPLLASYLDRDDDILLEETANALISFQMDEVIDAVLPYAKKEESIIFAISVLSGIKSPFAISGLKELMDELQDENERSLVFEALCHQLSTDALPEIEQFMKNDPDSNMIDVEQTAYGFYKIIGEDHPNLYKWKQIVEEKEKYLNERMEESKKTPQNEKIGRNDPCPCGSGKKYKKCCGK
jgi:hypothetical protein